jgi:hypothetical protein
MIRKLLSLAVTAAFAAAPLTAQTSFGIVAGGVSSNLTVKGGGTAVSYTTRTGFAAGVSLNHPLAKDFDFVPELLYVQKGAKLSQGSVSLAGKVAYVELPLLFRATFGSSTTTPFLLAGPAISVNASCKLSGTSGGTSVTENCDTNGGGVKSLDFGAMVGAGIEHNRFSVSIRYDLGLSNIDKEVTSGASTKNHAWMLLVGVSL